MPLFADSIRQFAAALTIAAIIVAMLVLGKAVLVPLAGAIILTFMLTPIIRWLMRWNFPRGAAVGTVVATIMGMIVGLALLFSTEMIALTTNFDSYRENIVNKIRSVTSVGQGDGVIGKAAQAIDRIGESVTREFSSGKGVDAAPGNSPGPIEVRNVDEGRSFVARLEAVIEPMAGAGLTFIFTLFLLMQYEDLRDRVVRVFGTDHLSDTTSAMGEAGARLSRLFLAQAALNGAYALLVGVVLWVLGVPGAFVWSVLSGLMRFVPFIGSFIAAAPPIVLAAGVSPDWTLVIVTVSFFILSELMMGNIVEPLVIGRHVGLSAFAMIAAASFWTLIWGPVGLLLAAPITIVAVVIGRYLSGLAFLSVLLGDEPALSDKEAVYQRLLAGDAMSIAERLEASAESSSHAATADAMVLPALQLASDDRSRENLSDAQAALIRKTLAEATSLVLSDTNADDQGELDDTSVVLVGARGDVDAIASAYLGRLLSQEAQRPTFISSRDSGLTALSAAHVALAGVAPYAVVVTTSGNASRRQMEFVLMRSRALFPNAKLITLAPKRKSIPEGEAEFRSADAIAVQSTKELVDLLKVRSAAAENSAPPSAAELQAAVNG